MGYKKLDEIMELLTDELDGFNKGIDRLERLGRSMDDIKVVSDTTAIERLLQEHLDRERAKAERLQECLQAITEQISKARLVPRIQQWIQYSIWFISLVIIGYLTLQVSLFEEVREKAFTEGRKKEVSDRKGYFDRNPGHYESYLKWIKEKESVPN